MWAGRLDVARELLDRLNETTLRSGIEFQRPYRLCDLANLELAAGRLREAAELAGDGLESALDAGNPSIAVWLRYPAALASAHGGDADAARATVVQLRPEAGSDEAPRAALMAHHIAGVVELAGADPGAALPELLDGVALARRIGLAHPGVFALLPDAVEAATASGDADLSAELAGELAGQAAALRLPWVDAAALRGRGLADVAPGMLADAAAAFDAMGCRLDAARARLAQGRALVQRRQRARAADVLTAVRDELHSIGAEAWAAQAAAQLARVMPVQRNGALTATETRIAELAASGRRNRDIAAELFVSVATVEAHLTRIYRKLGVRSRTELARQLGGSRR